MSRIGKTNTTSGQREWKQECKQLRNKCYWYHKKTSHWQRWHNTQSTILTPKLDLPQPGGAAATWLRSCQESVTDFGFELPPVRAVHFFWRGVGRPGLGSRFSWRELWTLNLASGQVDSKVTSLDWPGMISSKQNPPRLVRVTTLQPPSSSHQQITGFAVIQFQVFISYNDTDSSKQQWM